MQARAEAQGESWRVSLTDTDALFVPMKLNLRGGSGFHARLTINLVAKSLPGEKVCSYKEIYPVSLASAPVDAEAVRKIYDSYKGFDGDVVKSAILYQRLSAIARHRLDELETTGSRALAADIKALFNYLQVTRDMGRAICLKPDKTAERASRYLRGLADQDITKINGALFGYRNRNKPSGVVGLIEQIGLMEAYQFQVLWREVKTGDVKFSNCPNFVSLRAAYTKHFNSSQIIRIENSKSHRLLNLIEDALTDCVGREAEKVIEDQGYLDADNWERIKTIYSPTQVSGVGSVTAGAIRRHQEAIVRWAKSVSEPPPDPLSEQGPAEI